MVSQKTILRGIIGYQVGILIGLFGGLIVMLFMPMNIYLKIFTVIGLFSASLGTMYSLYEVYKQYKLTMMVEEFNNEKEVIEKNATTKNKEI